MADLVIIGSLALVLRVAYLALATAHMGFAAFARFAPDTNFYLILAQYFTEGHLRGPSVMLMVGPGYGAMLAGLRFLFGPGLLTPILLNIVLGALAPPLIYLLARRLTHHRLIAWTAGLLSACSLTSICFSNHILSDQPFYTFYAAALYCFVRGYQEHHRRWLIAAGVLLAVTIYIRASGQLAIPVLVLLACVLPVRPRYSSRRQLLSRVGITVLIAATAVYAWSFRNYVKEDQFVFNTLGMLTVRHCLVAQAMADDDPDKIQEYRIQWGREDGESDLVRYRGAYDRAEARVRDAWNTMPRELVYYFAQNVDQNLRAPIDYVPMQIPALSRPVLWLNDLMWRFWGRTLAVLALLGVFALSLGGRTDSAWILGMHFVAFTLFCGSSFWQGSRFHMPAEIAWVILVPVATWTLARFAYLGFARLIRGPIPRSSTVH